MLKLTMCLVLVIITLISPLSIDTTASLGSIAPSLRQMGWYHFPSCPFLPSTLKRKFSLLTLGVSAFECMDTLEQYCFSICEKMGVGEKYPPKSGILKKLEDQSENVQQPKVLQFEMTSLDQLDFETSPTKSQVNIYQKEVETDCNSIGTLSPSINRQIATDYEKENSIFQEARKGVWQCTQCSQKNFQMPSSIWEGDISPPSAFIANHAKECPGARASVNSLMGPCAQPQIPAKYTCKQHHPAHIHNYQTMNSPPKSSTSPSQQKNDDSSYAVHETGLVLSEDKELLTDFILITLEQLQVSYLESNNNRYALPEGFPGLECKHCSGTKTARRFFWSCPQRFKVSTHFRIMQS